MADGLEPNGSTIRYVNNIDDMLAFQRYFYAHSPAIRRRMAVMTWGGALAVLFGMPVILSALHPPGLSWTKVAYGAVAAVVYAFYIKWATKRNIGKLTRKLYDESSCNTFVGWRELEATPTGIAARSEHSESRIGWAAVERVASTDEYVFIFMGPGVAYVIPKNRIEIGSLSGFLAELGRNFDPIATLGSARHQNLGELPGA